MASLAELNYTTGRPYGEDFPLLMPKWGYVASAFVLFLIGFFGFFLNLLVILLMFRDRQLWTPLNIILFNLVCSDFSVSVLGNPFTLISALFHRWVFGHNMCVLYGFFMALLGITSITTLTVISFERYLMVTRPLSSRHLTCKGAAVSVLFIWIYSLALTTPPLMGWGNYVNEAANISCSVNWHEQSMNTLTYIMFLFAMGQVVPWIVITFSYVNIITTMKRNSRRLGRVSRAESRATVMVFIMIVSFTVAWTPYAVFALMEQFSTTRTISPGAGVIPALVAKSSICYDPLIYVGMNTQFRQSIKRVFGIHTKRSSSQTDRVYNNTLQSPAHRLCTFHDTTARFNSSDTMVSSTPIIQRDKTIVVRHDNQTETANEASLAGKTFELGTIQESKNKLDLEKSYSIDIAETSCSKELDDIVDGLVNNKYKEPTGSASKNCATCLELNKSEFVENDTYRYETSKTNAIKHSFSLELTKSPKQINRKYSVGTKLETFCKTHNFQQDPLKIDTLERDIKQTIDRTNKKCYICEFANKEEN